MSGEMIMVLSAVGVGFCGCVLFMAKMFSEGRLDGGFRVARGSLIPGILQEPASYHPVGLGDNGLGGGLERFLAGVWYVI